MRIIDATSTLQKRKAELQITQELYSEKITESSAINKLKKLYNSSFPIAPKKKNIKKLNIEIEELKKQIKSLKSDLHEQLLNPPPLRALRGEQMTTKNVISIFESSLTRTLNMETNKLSESLIIVRVYFFEVFRDIVLNGFDLMGEHYVVLTASAGQIRTKKCVFIKESLLHDNEATIMCGLTIDYINECGGCNPNKYLAYLALSNSATDPWNVFDIDKTIVVPDMETVVRGTVDYIDDATYQITRQDMDIPITHTDGCGMVLPELTNGKNTMVRLPWVKGLLAAFPFDQFVREANERDGWNNGIVKDIYGKQHDILAEGIQIIFTESQFKMHSFYKDWEQYKEYYKRYGCSAGICNLEEDTIENSTIGYQMLQSLTDLTDDELLKLSAKTRYKLEHICKDRKTMLKCLGATAGNPLKTPAQEALLIYPELLQDEYYREELRALKQSIEKWAWGGKLDIYAKYLFVVPDLYAFCEWLFLGNKNPQGLLENGHVYTAQFANVDKLDCLRSPSLYREHPVRLNDNQSEECQRWFSKNAIYTSCHDLISKVLMFDCDGDKLLTCAEPVLIEAAERNMEGVVPLYYNMRKAKPSIITPQVIFDGMTTAYIGGNIGIVSNSITKIWNSNNPDIDSIKRLCYKNNEVIDYAKTLYKSTPPKEIAKQMSAACNCDVPHFFVYAKDKENGQVAPTNNSPVNRLKNIVPKYIFKFDAQSYGKFDYHMLMDNPNLICTTDVERIIKEYKKFSKKIKIPQNNDAINMGEIDAYTYRFQVLREHMYSMSYNQRYVVDAIIYGIFGLHKSSRKKAFWGAFGEIVFENLKNNLSKQCDDMILCHKCHTRFIATDIHGICPYCGAHNLETAVKYCVDCGETFISGAQNRLRCDRCSLLNRREYKAKKARDYRKNVDKQN